MVRRKEAVVHWVSRAHLACLALIFSYGAVVGDLTTAYSHTVISVLFNPAFVGISMALSGTALSGLFSMRPQTSHNREQIATDDEIIWDDDRSHFRDIDPGGLSVDLNESMDFGMSDTHGPY